MTVKSRHVPASSKCETKMLLLALGQENPVRFALARDHVFALVHHLAVVIRWRAAAERDASLAIVADPAGGRAWITLISGL
jgi:hypothetical protein